MKFNEFLAAQHGLTYHQFNILPDERRVEIHAEWLQQPKDEAKRVDWGLIGFVVILVTAWVTKTVWR